MKTSSGTLAAVLAVTFVPLAAVRSPATAEELTTGVVRDRTGSSIPGAAVSGIDAQGRSTGTILTDPDGTFALESSQAPVAIRVGCDYCRATTLPVVVGVPLIIFVERYDALASEAPTPRDLGALPYARAEDAVRLRAFTVASPTWIADRYLDRSRGLVATNGIAGYRITDDATALPQTPSRWLAAVSTATPNESFRYGSYASAGVFDLEPYPVAEGVRAEIDSGASADAAIAWTGARAGVAAAFSDDSGIHRSRLDARAGVPFAGGIIDVRGSTATDDVSVYDGITVGYATASRRYETVTRLSATRLAQPGNAGSSLGAEMSVRNRGALHLEFGVRTRLSTGGIDRVEIDGTQRESALYAAIDDQTGAGGRVRAALALTSIARHSSRLDPKDNALALEPSLRYDLPLGARFAFEAQAVGWRRAPTLSEQAIVARDGDVAPIERGSLLETTLSYTENARVRTEATLYRESINGSATTVLSGAGLAIAWQVAPALALRLWHLRPSETFASRYLAPGSAPSTTSTAWLTYDTGGVRVDAIHRGGRFEGDVNLQIVRSLRLKLGSEVPRNTARRYVAGLRLEL